MLTKCIFGISFMTAETEGSCLEYIRCGVRRMALLNELRSLLLAYCTHLSLQEPITFILESNIKESFLIEGVSKLL